MEQSESIAALAAALSKAQGQIAGARKDSANPHFKSKYADLASVWDACREQLSANGLAVIQAPGLCSDGKIEMTTQIIHASGEWIRDTLSIPLGKVDAQGYGSATTYARRYALAAMVGIAPEDDDGNAASQPSQRSAVPQGVITGEQLRTLQGLADKAGADLRRFCAYLKVESLASLPVARFADAKSALEAKIEAAGKKEAA